MAATRRDTHHDSAPLARWQSKMAISPSQESVTLKGMPTGFMKKSGSRIFRTHQNSLWILLFIIIIIYIYINICSYIYIYIYICIFFFLYIIIILHYTQGKSTHKGLQTCPEPPMLLRWFEGGALRLPCLLTCISLKAKPGPVLFSSFSWLCPTWACTIG